MADMRDANAGFLGKLFLGHALCLSHFSDLRTDYLLIYHMQASPVTNCLYYRCNLFEL
jgi:hypothetical protein